MIISTVIFIMLGLGFIGYGYYIDSSENYHALECALVGVFLLGMAGLLSLIHWIIA